MLQLSLITVCLNNKLGLDETIRSVIKQDFIDFEFIIIDGGSNDGSIELMERYSSKISYWNSEKDNGIYNAMNKGIKKAQGKYLMFLNSGDSLVSENTLSKIFSQKSEADIIYGNLVRKKGRAGYRITKYPKKLSAYHFYSDVDSIHHQAACIKKEIFDKYGLYREDFSIISDWEFFFRTIILKNCTTQYINVNFTIFDSFGLSSNNNKTEQSGKLKILQEHIQPRLLMDLQELSNYKLAFKAKLKMKLSSTPFVYFITRLLYLPFMKLIEKINYVIIKK